MSRNSYKIHTLSDRPPLSCPI